MLDKKKLGLFYYLYDWANSPFSTVVITFIFSSYFVNSVANDKIEGTALWGWTIAISGLFLTILAPVMGYFGDYKKNLSSNFLFFSTFIVVILSSCLWFSQPSANYVFYTLMLVLASNTVYEMGQVFYNSELLKFKKQIPLGEFSGKAWASGYLGGIACLSIILFLVIIPDNNFLNLSKENFEHVRICGPVVGLWFLFFSIPFLISIKKINNSKITVKHSNFFESIKVALKDKNKINFLIARMIYTDGLITLFSFGGIYASGTFNFNFNEIIIFGILINISAAIGAYFLGFLEDRIGMKKVILISLFSLIIICFIILLIDEKILFWILGVSSGFFIGSIQSSSRTALIKISKQSELKKMFGLYAVSGKATNFLGPFLVASITTIFNSQRVGMSAILIFLILGALLLTRTKIE